jgi:hypothetical protein
MKLRQNGTVSFSIKLGVHRPAARLNKEPGILRETDQFGFD